MPDCFVLCLLLVPLVLQKWMFHKLIWFEQSIFLEIYAFTYSCDSRHHDDVPEVVLKPDLGKQGPENLLVWVPVLSGQCDQSFTINLEYLAQ